ncbi:MAG: nicotinate phosphoribosyltransferase [Candidatus Hermodarchaeia archaeon]|jgi:nicotinate phosphoribosyltransferase
MITESILDTDLYKLTMQQAALFLYPDAVAEYRFINRRLTDDFGPGFAGILREHVDRTLGNLALDDDELSWLEQFKFLNPAYLQYLKNFRFDPSQVTISEDSPDHLAISIKGKWHETILWEVPLMALISELHFRNDKRYPKNLAEEQGKKAYEKGQRLADAGVLFAEFGTRRRRDSFIHSIVTGELSKAKTFVGTSNLEIAHKDGFKPIGTMAHEWIQAHSVLCGLRHANRCALDAWMQVYQSDLGIALTDTYGTDAFFKDFDAVHCRTWDGVRHDSGDPFYFASRVVAHYKEMGIDPLSKTIVFSDGLDVDKAIEINEYCKGKIKCSFGIGTHFTNDFDTPALNMVIKLVELNGIPVVKLSDVKTKQVGDEDALRVANWTFFGTPLDEVA